MKRKLPERIIIRRSFFVAYLAFILLLLYTAAALANQNWNPMVFVFEGSQFRDGDPQGTVGYDGQFAYYIAADPLNARNKLDFAPYRYHRILYPTLAWLFSVGGSLGLLPWVMIAINVAAMTAAVGVFAVLLAKRGSRPVFALTLLLYAGTLITIRANLNEPLAICCAVLGLLLVDLKKLTLAGVAFAVGALSKESALVFAAGVVLWLLWQKEWREGLKLGVISVMPWLLWSVVLAAGLGQSPFGSQRTQLEAIPFMGMLVIESPLEAGLLVLIIVLPLITLTFLALLDIRNFATDYEPFLILTHFLLIALMPRLTWLDILASLRLAQGLVVAGLLYASALHPRMVMWLAVLWGITALIGVLIPDGGVFNQLQLYVLLKIITLG